MRWGVTDEAAAEGKVLPICLEEIKRCRPYFISLLGERYGWAPQSIPEELIEREHCSDSPRLVYNYSSHTAFSGRSLATMSGGGSDAAADAFREPRLR